MSLTKEQKLELEKLQRVFGKLEGIAAAENLSVDEYMAYLGEHKEEGEAFRKFVATKAQQRKNVFNETTADQPVNVPYFGSF